jgi:hypothetical protein
VNGRFMVLRRSAAFNPLTCKGRLYGKCPYHIPGRPPNRDGCGFAMLILDDRLWQA